MPQVNVFQWRNGRGWLVLAGGGPPDSDENQTIEAQMLGHTHSLGPIAYIWAASDPDTADSHMDLLRELGARTGFLVDILSEEEEVLFREISQAGVIILGDGSRREVLREALAGAALRAIEDAYERGATVYAVGSSAALLGAYLIEGDNLVGGYKWLDRAIVQPGYTPEQADLLREQVQRIPDAFGLGIGEGSALALGPEGEVAVWGNPAITISLGQRYQPDGDSFEEE